MVLDRYIARSIVTGTVLALFVLGALFAFIEFVGELGDIGKQNYGLLQALFYVALSLPQKLYELAPSVILLGGLISLGAMAANSELIVMRASGMTSVRIVRSVLQIGMVMAILVAVAGEYVVPRATIKAKSLRAVALDNRVLLGSAQGLWARDGNRFVNVGRALPGMQLRDISVYELDDKRALHRTTFARRAHYDGAQWILDDVSHSVMTADTIIASNVATETWSALIRPELFNVLNLDPEDMSARDLYQYSDYLSSNELDADPFRLALWIKAFTPATCLVMLLIAMPLVFNATPRSGGTGQRIMVGLLLGIAFFVFNRASNHLGLVYGLMPALSAALPLLLVTSISVVMIRRIR